MQTLFSYSGELANRIFHGDCRDILRSIPDQSIDLVLGSPPYEKARTYGIDFKLKGEEWVEWMKEIIRECCRVCRGPVIVVCEGQTKDFRYSCAPILLMADLHREGYNLRKPPIFYRVGIPGSGGPDWFRNDYEYCVAITPPGKLPYSEPTAMGKPTKYAPGGEMSNRTADGRRVNAQLSTSGDQRRNAGKMQEMIATDGAEPKVQAALDGGLPPGAKLHTKSNGKRKRVQCYVPPKIANPGNVIQETYTATDVTAILGGGDVSKHSVGGGRMGSMLAHSNEAPFPETLAEFFIRSLCPPGGIVLDPWSGSGTTAAVAEKHGRKWVAIDVRESQVELIQRRIEEVRAA